MSAPNVTKAFRVQKKLIQIIKSQRQSTNLRFPSVREIAQQHDISTVTANKVVSNLIAQGFLVKREGVGTFISPQETNNFSVKKGDVAYCLGHTTFSLDFFELFSAFMQQSREVGLSLSIFGRGNLTENLSTRELVKKALDENYETLLIGPVDAVTVRSIDDLLRQAKNVVLFGNEEKLPFDAIGIDAFRAGYLAGKYYAEMGHRNVLLLNSHLQARPDGFLKAFADKGIELSPRFVIPSTCTEQGGYDVVKYALEAGLDFTGVMTASNESTVGALFALYGAKLKIPNDISIISFGDATPLRSIAPVTSISLRTDEIVKKSLEFIIEKLNGNSEPLGNQMIEAVLVDRGSVKPLESKSDAQINPADSDVFQRKNISFDK